TEVDDTVLALVPPALVAGGDAAVAVTTPALAQRAQQRLLGRRAGDLGEIRDARPATTGGRGLVFADSHEVLSSLTLPAVRRSDPGSRWACCRPRGSRSRAWCSCAVRTRCGCAYACPY